MAHKKSKEQFYFGYPPRLKLPLKPTRLYLTQKAKRFGLQKQREVQDDDN